MMCAGHMMYSLAGIPRNLTTNESHLYKKELVKMALRVGLAALTIFAVQLAPTTGIAIGIGFAATCLSIPAAMMAFGGFLTYQAINIVASGFICHGEIIRYAEAPIQFAIATGHKLLISMGILEMNSALTLKMALDKIDSRYFGILEKYAIEPLSEKVASFL